MYNIKTLRGTIFCPPIQYSKDFVASLAPIVEGYLPILVRDNNTLPIFPVWQLSSLDEKELLAFNGEKIDLISVVESEINDEQVRAFCERCKVVFGKIMELTGNPSTRMALAPDRRICITAYSMSTSLTVWNWIRATCHRFTGWKK